jgi:hypothetical protein
MVGGIFTVLELVVYPAIYEIWKWHFEMKPARADAQPAVLVAAVARGSAVSVDVLRVSAHTPPREMTGSFWSGLQILWCKLTRPAPMQPVRGYYRCPAYRRIYPVPWGGGVGAPARLSDPSRNPKVPQRKAAVLAFLSWHMPIIGDEILYDRDPLDF